LESSAIFDSHPPDRKWSVPVPWYYLYRAIDSTGATIDFLLSALRDAAAAQRLFRRALSDPSHSQPRVINTDRARLYGAAIILAGDVFSC